MQNTPFRWLTSVKQSGIIVSRERGKALSKMKGAKDNEGNLEGNHGTGTQVQSRRASRIRIDDRAHNESWNDYSLHGKKGRRAKGIKLRHLQHENFSSQRRTGKIRRTYATIRILRRNRICKIDGVKHSGHLRKPHRSKRLATSQTAKKQIER